MRGKSQKFIPRQHMRTETFEVFHFRDTALEPVAIHQHDFYEVYFFLEGQVEYRVEGRAYCMAPGDLLLINPMEFHQPVIRSGKTLMSVSCCGPAETIWRASPTAGIL